MKLRMVKAVFFLVGYIGNLVGKDDWGNAFSRLLLKVSLREQSVFHRGDDHKS